MDLACNFLIAQMTSVRKLDVLHQFYHKASRFGRSLKRVLSWIVRRTAMLGPSGIAWTGEPPDYVEE